MIEGDYRTKLAPFLASGDSADIENENGLPPMSNDDARLKRSLEFTLTDVLILVQGLQYAETEAVCERKPLARAQMKALVAQMKAMIPAEADLFEAFDFSQIGVALRTARSARVSIQPVSWESPNAHWRDGQVEVLVKDRDGTSLRVHSEGGRRFPRDDEERVRVVAALIQEITPLGVEITLGREGEEFEPAAHQAALP